MRLSLADMSTSHALLGAGPTDAELVTLSRTGNREVFAQIVARYQSLICSLAYSGSGNLAQSEDLAQETFLIAWRQLHDLREPAKLRAWLCEIARSRVYHWQRKQGREPTQAADSLQSADTLASPGPSPATLAIQHDEETILWREMEKIPELYREPLILFYRQHQSIENVAAALDLSEDTVRQRLSRGRKLLQEQVQAFVEGTLARTNPGSGFTMSVMAALPMAVGSTSKTALAAATAAKGLAATKATGFLGILSTLLGPLIGIFAGFEGAATGLRFVRPPAPPELVDPTVAAAREAAQEEERADPQAWRKKQRAYDQELFKKAAIRWKTFPYQPLLIFWALLIPLGIFLWLVSDEKHPVHFINAHWNLCFGIVLAVLISAIACWIWGVVATIAYFRNRFEGQRGAGQSAFTSNLFRKLIFISLGVGVGIGVLSAIYFQSNPALVTAGMAGLLLGFWRFRSKIKKSMPGCPNRLTTKESFKFSEYRSPWVLFGMPVVHTNFGRTLEGKRRVAKGWIAMGSRAVGFVAIGGTAVGVLSVGPAAIGLVAVGAVALGPLAIGCLAMGYWATGGIALGYLATGGLALGWQEAHGAFAAARNVAQGDIVYTAHAHGPAALTDNDFFANINSFLNTAWITGGLVLLLGVLAFASALRARIKLAAEPVVEEELDTLTPQERFKLSLSLSDSMPEPVALGREAVLWMVTIVLAGVLAMLSPATDQAQEFAVTAAICSAIALACGKLLNHWRATDAKFKAQRAADVRELTGFLLVASLGRATTDSLLIAPCLIGFMIVALRLGWGKFMGVTSLARWKIALESISWIIYAAAFSVARHQHWFDSEASLLLHIPVLVLGIAVGLRLLFWEKYHEIQLDKTAKMKELAKAKATMEPPIATTHPTVG